MQLGSRTTGPRVTLSYLVCWFLLSFAICAVAVEKLFPPIVPPPELAALKAITIQILTSLAFLCVVWFSSECMGLIRQAVRAPVRKVDWTLLVLAGIASAGWALGMSRLLTVLPRELLVPVEWFGAGSVISPTRATSWIIVIQPIIGAVVLAPVVEEMAIRGVMLPAWLQCRGVVVSVLASSALFGLMHGAERLIMATVSGILFALLYLHYQSIWPGVLVHALHNLLVQPVLLGHWAYGKSPAEARSWIGWGYEIGLSVVMLLCGFLAWRRARAARRPRAMPA
jgi:membrane protease YdiL (CAAX protease family)